ncbi:ZIP family metal transporter [Paenibacillus taichungensis]|uniref:ZIP family metal transporter n=2 Tax=Paenibacillus TaxID=44249 RepID=UPI0037F85B12
MSYMLITIALITVAVVSSMVVNRYSRWIVKHKTPIVAINMSVLLTFTVMELIPQAVEFTHEGLIFIVLGILIPFLMHNISHRHEAAQVPSQALMFIMIGTGIHSLVDGMLMAIGFIMEDNTGAVLLTTMIIHKFTEMLMFAMILVTWVSSTLRLMIYLLYLSMFTILGMVGPLFLNGSWSGFENLSGIALSLSSGFFIFMSLTALFEVVESAKVKHTHIYPFVGCALYFSFHLFLH